MTYQRVINRNGMHGDYGTKLSSVNLDFPGTLSDEKFKQVMAEHWQSALKFSDAHWGNVMGDLRRLEKDTVDEHTVCQHIATVTNINAEIVAVVLKEFLNY